MTLSLKHITLLENQTTDGSGSVITWQGGYGTLAWDGTFDTATVTLEVADQDGGGFSPVIGGVFTSKLSENIQLGTGTKLRATVNGAGASTDLTLRIMK